MGVTLGSNKISKQSPQSCNESNMGLSRRHWVGKIQNDRSLGPRGSPIQMKYIFYPDEPGSGEWLSNGPSINDILDFKKTGELVKKVMLIMFAVVLYINTNIGSSFYIALFP